MPIDGGVYLWYNTEKKEWFMKKYTYLEVFKKIQEVFDTESVQENRKVLSGLEAFKKQQGEGKEARFVARKKADFPKELQPYVDMVEKDRLLKYLQMQYEGFNNVKQYAMFINTMLDKFQQHYEAYENFISNETIEFVKNKMKECELKADYGKGHITRYKDIVLEDIYGKLDLDTTTTSFAFESFTEEDFAQTKPRQLVEQFISMLQTAQKEFEYSAKQPQKYSDTYELGESAYKFEQDMKRIQEEVIEPVLQALTQNCVPSQPGR